MPTSDAAGHSFVVDPLALLELGVGAGHEAAGARGVQAHARAAGRLRPCARGTATVRYRLLWPDRTAVSPSPSPAPGESTSLVPGDLDRRIEGNGPAASCIDPFSAFFRQFRLERGRAVRERRVRFAVGLGPEPGRVEMFERRFVRIEAGGRVGDVGAVPGFVAEVDQAADQGREARSASAVFGSLIVKLSWKSFSQRNFGFEEDRHFGVDDEPEFRRFARYAARGCRPALRSPGPSAG